MRKVREICGKTGLILAGGGLRGIFHVWVAEILSRSGITFDYIAGASIGALVGEKLAEAQNPEELPFCLEEIKFIFFERIDKIGAKYVFPFSAWPCLKHFYKYGSFLPNDTLLRLVANVKPEKLLNSPTQFDFTVFNNDTKRHEIFSNRDPLFRTHPELIAPADASSAAIMPIFLPIKIGNYHYSDGGSITGLISRAIAFGCKTIFVAFPYPKVYFEPQLKSNFFGKFPGLNRFFANYAANLRMLDELELRVAEDHNKETRLRAQNAILEDVKGGAIGRFKAHISMLRQKNEVLVVPFYANPPETLSLAELQTSGKNYHGDFEESRRRTEQWLPKLVEKILKQ